MKRKVAVIMAADVVGYSRLMSENEEGTVQRLMLHRLVFEEHIHRGYGRIFNTAGDAVLAEFPSSVDALRVAVDVQEIIASQNEGHERDQKMLFRIGITVGDVLEREGDLLGDAVNIAARLEGIAEPGGICVSQAIFEQVAKKIDIKFKSLGMKSVKNIPDKLQVFSVVRSPEPQAQQGRSILLGRKKPSILWRHKWKGAVAIVALVFVVSSGRDHGHSLPHATIATDSASPSREDAESRNAVAVTPRTAGDSAGVAPPALPVAVADRSEPPNADAAADAGPGLPRGPSNATAPKSPSPGLGDIAYGWLKSKADAGDFDAMNSIGVMYRTGLGRDQDDAQAQRWFKLAVDHHNVVAMLNLARMYLDANSRFHDDFEGLRLLRRAVDERNGEAMELLGEMYYQGDIVAQDAKKAAPLIKSAAEAGDAKAMGNLCYFYMDGSVFPKNYDLAANWCQKGADGGDPGAKGNLAALYVNGWGVSQSDAKAFQLYKDSASEGNATSMNILGSVFQNGRMGQPVDPSQSAAWYRKAAEAGNVEAMDNVGVLYLNGTGVAKDIPEAKKWIEKAIAAGDVHSLYNLGAIFEADKDVKSQRHAFELYRQAAEKGDSEAMLMVGLFYYEGRSMPKNAKLGLDWLTKAKQAGVVEADAVLKGIGNKH